MLSQENPLFSPSVISLTQFYFSLKPPLNRNKYEVSSNLLHFDYRLIDGYAAISSPLPDYLKRFVIDNKEVIALPNIFHGHIVGLLLRSITVKQFRYYAVTQIPYGSGVNEKPYLKPWVVVESCLDSDFLRTFYPYVIASLGTTLSHSLESFLFNTAPYVIFGFDRDESGDKAYKRIAYKYRNRVLKLDPPIGNKDFGDTLSYLCTGDSTQFDLESAVIQSSLQEILC